jgi:uncharacterized membrane protein/glutaredoxin
MSRRRSVPWMHRFARPIIGGIATLGVLNTGYLTYSRLFGAAVCPTNTCAVLASRYATVFGQPLSLFGLLAYLAIAVLALAPLLVNPEGNKSLRSDVEEKSWLFLFLGTTAMLLFSGYLMFIMFSEFVFGGRALGVGGICYFCLFSAISATAMFVLTLLGRAWDDRGSLFFNGAIVALITLVGTLIVYAPDNSIVQNTANAYTITDGANRPAFYVESETGDAEKQLAEHLKSTGATLYTSYTCPHCCDQKQLFGKDAVSVLPNVECNAAGKDSKVAVCKQEFEAAEAQTKQAAGFPTWKINGTYYSGVQKLDRLAQLSGYKGPQNFKNEFKPCRQAN